MKICLLTYDTPHRKTAQIVLGLKNRGFSSLDMLLMPFSQRAKRTVCFNHRPDQFVGPSPRSLAIFARSSIFPYSEWPILLPKYDFFLVCGSNLIEPEFSKSGKILNVHAGLIPAVRGLDAFKWAILDMQPVGNTLHRIDERADSGEVIATRPTPLFEEDDLQSFAERHYESEIWMLQNFDKLIDLPPPKLVTERPARMRMPLETEKGLFAAFDEYKKRFSVRK